MSVICFKKYEDRIVFAADTQITDGYLKQNKKGLKLWQCKKYIICGIGSMNPLSVIRLNLDNNSTITNIIKENSLGEDMKNQVIYAFNKYSNTVTMYIDKEERVIDNDFYTAGSGGDYALAVLDLGNSVEDAVRMACKYDLYCSIGKDGVDIQEYRFKNKN